MTKITVLIRKKQKIIDHWKKMYDGIQNILKNFKKLQKFKEIQKQKVYWLKINIPYFLE